MSEENLSSADAEIMKLATQDVEAETPEAKPEPKPAEPLELGGEDAPELTEEQKAEEAGKKTRSQRWEKRVDNLTARLREAERRAEEAEAKASGQPTAQPSLDEVKAKAPKPEDYEFGSADPAYLEARQDWRFELRDAEARAKTKQAAELTEKQQGQQQLVSKLSDGMANVEKTGAEKYDDFEAKIASAVESRGGEPLPPLVSVGIAVSPAGADIAYRLASDEEASDKLENLAKTNPQQAAVAFGELEGEFVDDDSDLNLSDPMDMARMLGRMKSRLAGKGQGKAVKTTKAPAPAQQARGSAGKFEAGDDTEDFASFERKIMGGRG